jgi:hypothetical protein
MSAMRAAGHSCESTWAAELGTPNVTPDESSMKREAFAEVLSRCDFRGRGDFRYSLQ